MKEVYINGIGISSILGNSIDELLANINNQYKAEEYKYESIPKLVNSKFYRKLDRFSHIAFNSVLSAVEDSKLELLDKNKIGTVFNTTYGPGVTNMVFADSVAKGDPDLASPAVFTNTVINACLGHICMYFGLKGVSTMLLCSNGIGYSMRLLENCKATDIFTGGVEEYNKAIFDGFKNKGYTLVESAITILLSREEKLNCYSKIISYHEENLLKHPYVGTCSFDEQDVIHIKGVMGNALNKGNLEVEDIDIVITTMDNFECFNLEEKAIKSLFNNIPKISFKQHWGDFLGSSAHFGVLLASEIIKKQMVPKLFDTYNIKKTIKKILVNNYDKDGSFTTYIISSTN